MRLTDDSVARIRHPPDSMNTYSGPLSGVAAAAALPFLPAFALAFVDAFFTAAALQRPALSARLPPLQVAASAAGSRAIRPPASTTSILPNILMACVSCRCISDVGEFTKGKPPLFREKKGGTARYGPNTACRSLSAPIRCAGPCRVPAAARGKSVPHRDFLRSPATRHRQRIKAAWRRV
jgi:hypothetical protein